MQLLHNGLGWGALQAEPRGAGGAGLSRPEPRPAGIMLPIFSLSTLPEMGILVRERANCARCYCFEAFFNFQG